MRARQSESSLLKKGIPMVASLSVAEISAFYSRFHSMRLVGKDLVLRLHRAPDAAELAALEREYRADLCSEGSFGVVGAFEEELEFRELPRLAFRFNRRAWSRLRSFIDALNGAPARSRA